MEKFLRSKRRRQLRLIKNSSRQCSQQVVVEAEAGMCLAKTVHELPEQVLSPPESCVGSDGDQSSLVDTSGHHLKVSECSQLDCSEPDVVSDSLACVQDECFGPYSAGVSDELPGRLSLNVHDTEGMRSRLKTWALKNNVRGTAVDSLLQILNPHFPDVPKDHRTLLSTPRDVPTVQMSDGQYVHFGLHAGLLRALDEWHRLNVVRMVQTVEVSFNIDGLPLFKSSGLQVWPILAQVHHPSNKHFDVVFPVGIYCGTSKPQCLQEYLDQFVQELAEVLSCGLC